MLSAIRKAAGEAWVYLDPCALEEEVADWERVHCVRLPEAYRRFLLEIGAGGEGPPEFGLWSLECQDPRDAEAFRGAFLERELQNSFPFEAAWRWTPDEERAYQEGCPELRERVRLRDVGTLTLGTDGETVFWHLIVTGPARGQVWWSDGLSALEPRATDFLSWYQDWLSEAKRH